MPAYFDSSVLVAMVTNERHAARARDLWSAEPVRVSSILLAIECENVVRRRSVAEASLAASARPLLGEALSEVTLKNVDADVLRVANKTPALTRCLPVQSGRCEIHLQGHLNSRWIAWFDGPALTQERPSRPRA